MKRLVLENKNCIVDQIRSYIDKNSEAKFIHRLQVVLLFASSEKESCDSLGALFGNSPRSVSNWIKKVNRTGNIESLRNIPQPGNPPKLMKDQKKEIKEVLLEPPDKHGLEGKKWNGRILSSYISQRYGIALNIRSCQHILKETTANI